MSSTKHPNPQVHLAPIPKPHHWPLYLDYTDNHWRFAPVDCDDKQINTTHSHKFTVCAHHKPHIIDDETVRIDDTNYVIADNPVGHHPYLAAPPVQHNPRYNSNTPLYDVLTLN